MLAEQIKKAKQKPSQGKYVEHQKLNQTTPAYATSSNFGKLQFSVPHTALLSPTPQGIS